MLLTTDGQYDYFEKVIIQLDRSLSAKRDNRVFVYRSLHTLGHLAATSWLYFITIPVMSTVARSASSMWVVQQMKKVQSRVSDRLAYSNVMRPG